MDEDKKMKKIVLSTTEVKIPEEEAIYDQNIGKEIRIDLEEVKYEEATDISEVVEGSNDVEELSENILEESESSEEEPKDDEIEDSEEEAEPEDSEEKSEDDESDASKEEPVEKTKEEIEKEITSDKKTIKISSIIALVLGVIALILFLTRGKNVEGEPVIKLVGPETVILEEGDEYEEQGYFAVDSEDGDLTDKVTIIGEVDTTKPGIYSIKYKVLDSSRTRTEVYRNVVVTSKENDFDFKLKGKEFVTITKNADYIEEGYEAFVDGKNVGSDVKVFGKVDRGRVGNNYIYYALENNGKVAVLKRLVIVHKGEEMDSDATLVSDLNNWLIDEIHYSNQINLNNVSPSVLLYFGALNCRNESSEIKHEEMINCLKKTLNLKDVIIKGSNKYEGKNASITYDKNKDSWIINKLELPRVKDNIIKVIVEDNNIYLYENYAYAVSLSSKELCDGNNNKIYYSGLDLEKIIGFESCKEVCENGSCNKVSNKKYEPVTYVHTFRVLNGKYYWVSSNVVK